MMWMLGALWLVVAHDTDTAYMDDVMGNLFPFLVFNKWCTILKCLWDYFRLKQVKALKNVKQELLTKKKNGVLNGDKKSSWILKNA